MIPKHLPSQHIKKKSCASKAIKIFSFLKKNAVSLIFFINFYIFYPYGENGSVIQNIVYTNKHLNTMKIIGWSKLDNTFLDRLKVQNFKQP